MSLDKSLPIFFYLFKKPALSVIDFFSILFLVFICFCHGIHYFFPSIDTNFGLLLLQGFFLVSLGVKLHFFILFILS